MRLKPSTEAFKLSKVGKDKRLNSAIQNKNLASEGTSQFVPGRPKIAFFIYFHKFVVCAITRFGYMLSLGSSTCWEDFLKRHPKNPKICVMSNLKNQ